MKSLSFNSLSVIQKLFKTFSENCDSHLKKFHYLIKTLIASFNGSSSTEIDRKFAISYKNYAHHSQAKVSRSQSL